MCLLTYIQPDAMPDMIGLENGADANPHGHGWAIVADGEIHVGHSMNADRALTMFEVARKALPQDGPALFHSRIATAGILDTYNCHPFYVGGDHQTVLAHNGILPKSAQPLKHDDRSDTHLFADYHLPRGNYGHFSSRNQRRRLRKWLGYGNKMVVLTVNPEYTAEAYILNEHLGDWTANGSWWSNDSWKDEPWWMDPRYATTTTRFGSGSTHSVSEGTKGVTMGPRTITVSSTGQAHVEDLDDNRVSGEQCPFCNAVGLMSSVSYKCYNCFSCSECGRGFDDCKCEARPEYLEAWSNDSVDEDIHMVSQFLARELEAE